MRGHMRFFLLLLAAVGFSAFAADDSADVTQRPQPTETAVGEAADSYRLAPVVIDDVTLFRVRGVSARPAQVRADDIAAKIVEIARDARIAADTLKVEERPFVSAILAGEQVLMVVTDADARLEGLERQPLAAVYTKSIEHAIIRYRSDREPGALALGAVYAIGALAALAAALYGLVRLYRKIDAILERRYRARLEHLRIKGFKVLHAEHLWGGVRSLVSVTHALAALVLLYLALHLALRQFPGTRWIAHGLLDAIVEPLAKIGSGLVASIPNLIFLAILVLVIRYVLKTLRLFFDAIEHGSVKLSGFDPDWSGPTYHIVRLLVLAFAVVVAYPYIPGSESAAFKGVSVFLGIVFTLGSSSIVGNIIAGYSMTYRRAFRVGDRIRVGEVLGDVTEVRLQVTHLRSLKNEEIVIPNSVILGSHVINYSTLARTSGLILHTSVNIGYGTPWRQVEAMLLLAAERTSCVLREPPPFILQKALGEFAVTYELNAYCDRPAEMLRIYTDLHRNILDLFNQYGVAIMTPAYEGDPERPKIVAKEQWYAEQARPPDTAAGGGTAGTSSG